VGWQFFAFVGVLGGFMLAIIIGTFLPTHFVEVGRNELVSLRGGCMTEGSFVLGCGSLSSNLYYIYYKKNNSGYQQGMVEVSDNVTIFEDEIITEGTLKIYQRKFVNPWNNNIALMLHSEENKKYEFHIPKGSLKKNFILE
jgi:hypothetical protein